MLCVPAAQVMESQIVVNQAQDSIILPCFSEPWKSDVNNWLFWVFSSSDKERGGIKRWEPMGGIKQYGLNFSDTVLKLY